jgi:glyoxylase-like metal-dependent hydrolase (beta-lactamase superfamily II)/rhodanese-related sulfurtransferase
MIFRQFLHEDLGCASYVVGDEHAGVAAVVDPRLEIDEYLALARYLDVRIEHVLETHTHADHVSGHGRLAAATGATIHIHRVAAPDYDHEPFEDGWTLELGRVLVRAVHAPGHRPEHSAFLLIDSERAPEPWAVLTGDSLFVGDVARPDLAVEKEEGAREMFHSLHERLLSLPDETEVWPGHVGGSLCGGPAMDMKVSSTVGFEHRHSPLLQEADEEAFVTAALAALRPQPPNFRRIVELNRGPLDTGATELLPLSPRQVEQRRDNGALIVDVRTDLQFDEAHVEGSVCVTALHGGFGTKLAWLAEPGQEVVLVGRDDADAHLAAGLAAAVGVRTVSGYLAGGMTSWRLEGRDVRRVERIGVTDLRERTQADSEVQILDVREAAEWRDGHIPGAAHTAYHDLDALPADLDPERAIAVICASGQRSAVAAGLVQRLGATTVLHVAGGGVPTWQRAGYPIEP